MNNALIKPMGGTEIMVAGLQERLGWALEHVSLGVNCLPSDLTKPVIVWIHHDIDQPAIHWLENAETHKDVAAFVFVSHWQRERFEKGFNLPPRKCHVLRNAVSWRQDTPARTGMRYAYTSTPFRGLDVLLRAWGLSGLGRHCELHVWSSMAIYGQPEGQFEKLYEIARTLEGVHYHGYAPNHKVRESLSWIDYLVYPATWEETSCLSVIEAMAAGCKVICPSYGALPETTAGFAQMYPWIEDKKAHAEEFARQMKNARYEDSLLQVAYTRHVYDWETRALEWRRVLGV